MVALGCGIVFRCRFRVVKDGGFPGSTTRGSLFDKTLVYTDFDLAINLLSYAVLVRVGHFSFEKKRLD